MRYYIIAGEASGDKHAAKVVEAILKEDSSAIVRGWGGDLMMSAGADIVKHYKELAFMGFVEVAKNIGTILANFRLCKEDISSFKPDVVLLVDYPGFNMRMAKWLKKKHYKTLYYISPQAWAWNEKRVYDIQKYVDHLYVILPFEKAFYAKFGIDVTYVGHPLKSQIDDYMGQNPVADKNVIALLPGSRQQEIKRMTPVFFETAQRFPDEHFVVAKAPHINDSTYQAHLSESHPNISFTEEGTYSLLNRSKAALCTSGTATLETALFKVPQAVCYKGNALSYQLAKRLIKVKYISLVNLIADDLIVREFIQRECNADFLEPELQKLISSDDASQQYQLKIKNGLKEVHERLILEGDPSVLLVNDMLNRLK